MLYLFKIIHSFAKNDALFFARKIWLIKVIRFIYPKRKKLSDGVKLKRALSQLGPSFIKLGQALSLRPDIVGKDIALDLSELQDKLPPFESYKAKQIVEKELRHALSTLFTSFEETPVAAASIAQVHFAKTTDGREVAVKILRPDIEKTFKRDIRLFKRIARYVTSTSKRFKLMRLKELVADFENQVKRELNMQYEAACANELKECLNNITDIVKIPDIDWDRTSKRVLSTERLHGVKINDKQALAKAKHKASDIIPKLARLYIEQLYNNGFFHADLHPGNVMVLKDGRVGLLDFGIMGNITEREKRYIASIAYNYVNRNYDKLADIHIEAGYVPKNTDRKILALHLRSIGEPMYGGEAKHVSIAKLLEEMIQITEQFNMETQPQLILLQKTMVYMEGLTNLLDEDDNFWLHCRPHLEAWVKKNLKYKAAAKDAKDEVKKFINNIKELNDRFPDILEKL